MNSIGAKDIFFGGVAETFLKYRLRQVRRCNIEGPHEKDPSISEVGFAHSFFPFRNATGRYAKERIWPRALHSRQLGPPLRIACSKFFHQVMPLEFELAARNREVAGSSGGIDLLGHKTVTTVHRLSVYDPQILRDESDWKRLLPKPNKLWVVDISTRLSRKYGLRKKSFPPQSNQPASVKVFRMQAPNSHCCR